MVRSFLRNGRKHYGTSSSWERHDHARRQSCNTAIANFARAAEQGIGHQPQNCCHVAQAFDRGRSEDRSEKAALNRSHRSGGGNDRCIQAAEGKLYLFVGIDRTSKFAVTQLVEKADRKTAWEFLEHLLKTVPYRIHTILTDNGIQFAEQPRNRNTAYSRQMRFDMICEANGIEHRLTKPNHPWTNGQVERMNRKIKEATVKRYHYDNHDQLRTHLADLMAAYNFARRLKTLSGLTPYEYICKIWTSEPDRFNLNPIHQMPGLNT